MTVGVRPVGLKGNSTPNCGTLGKLLKLPVSSFLVCKIRIRTVPPLKVVVKCK